jgi:hypothetical protein
MEKFYMPMYRDIPDVGLYLEQVTRYINGVLEPLGGEAVTSSMISNYVKKGCVSKPIKKLYYAEQIAQLFFIVIAKNALSIENIGRLFEMQRRSCSLEAAYDNFCAELEGMLRYTFGISSDPPPMAPTAKQEEKMLRSTIVAVSQIIYLSHRFEVLKEQEEKDTKIKQLTEPQSIRAAQGRRLEAAAARELEGRMRQGKTTDKTI